MYMLAANAVLHAPGAQGPQPVYICQSFWHMLHDRTLSLKSTTYVLVPTCV